MIEIFQQGSLKTWKPAKVTHLVFTYNDDLKREKIASFQKKILYP